MKNMKTENNQQQLNLVNLVFSWSIKDVLDKNLIKNKVQQIPDNNFTSTSHYLDSFKMPLIEETRAEYCSGLESISQAPMCEILYIQQSQKFKSPNNLLYVISTTTISDIEKKHIHYKPESGDLFAITTLRPRSINDLIKPYKSLHLAFVTKSEDKKSVIEILSSEIIEIKTVEEKNERLFVTYLMNLTTNLRIWKALHPDPKSSNMGLIQNVLAYDSSVDDECQLCILGEENDNQGSNVSNLIKSFGLDESQREAIFRCNSLRKCLHNLHTVKLIWGPPGTGKTKTVASFLFVQLKLKYRTLTCAPTNIAVVQVAERLVRIFKESLVCGSYGLGDIVLFGNEKRMKICDHKDLEDICLKTRVKIIRNCLKPFTGWSKSLESMISILENPKQEYRTYLRSGKKEEVESDTSDKDDECEDNVEVSRKISTKKSRETKRETIMTFEEFVWMRFCILADRLMFCAENFCTHLPTSCLSFDVAKQMIQLVDLLHKTLEIARKSDENKLFELIVMNGQEILGILKALNKQFPKLKITGEIDKFCLDNACLVFCTASGSIKVQSPVEMVIIDEAAQLKECESAIPLQIPGLKTAVLIGDDRQLPAMVQSKVLERTNFGRSLFQRLVTLGKKKHLLNIQYRMHPSISLFPNKEFYENKIVDGENVKETSHIKKFLKGEMFGSYSFINVSKGTENYGKGHSPRNFEEAFVIDQIIAKLYAEHYCITKQKVSVGVISPYKGQVGLLQEKLGKKYTSHKDKFCINIRSVDGFQGGEEDIIIISTVRSNGNGSVGFLSNFQRTNVALTRARYCLWIVGSGSTLGNSDSVWKNLVLDAKTRGCFYDATDSIYLKIKATSAGESKLFEGQKLEKATLENESKFFECLKLEKARWRVIFSDEFKKSISNTKSAITKIRVKEVLHKIADGWRQPKSDKRLNAFELLEQYEVQKNLNLVWSVDLIEQNGYQLQVIKIWDILPESRICSLAESLSAVFGSYTVEFMNRCKYKSFEGDLVVPMSWPDPCSYGASSLKADPAGNGLSNQLDDMNLGVVAGASAVAVAGAGASAVAMAGAGASAVAVASTGASALAIAGAGAAVIVGAGAVVVVGLSAVHLGTILSKGVYQGIKGLFGEKKMEVEEKTENKSAKPNTP